jgi:hypothetical protein
MGVPPNRDPFAFAAQPNAIQHWHLGFSIRGRRIITHLFTPPLRERRWALIAAPLLIADKRLPSVALARPPLSPWQERKRQAESGSEDVRLSCKLLHLHLRQRRLC